MIGVDTGNLVTSVSSPPPLRSQAPTYDVLHKSSRIRLGRVARLLHKYHNFKIIAKSSDLEIQSRVAQRILMFFAENARIVEKFIEYCQLGFDAPGWI